jgi:phosphoribosylformylglycinamidine synthase subunit PurQ / glutaminase
VGSGLATQSATDPMKSAVVIFPGINRDRDITRALETVTGVKPHAVWHTDTEIPPVDLIVLPGGFSYGDYLRCGAIAARSPVMGEIARQAARGVNVLGICNGFQILTEAGLLPGILMRNAALRFACRNVRLRIENNRTFLTRRMPEGAVLTCPVAHGEGNYFADPETLARLEGGGQVVFRYVESTNCNGSINDIAGIASTSGNVIGMMPHPENMIEPLHGSTDCRALFEGLAA